MLVCILLGNSFGQLVSPRLSLSKMAGLFTANPNPPADCGLGGLPIASAWGIAD